MHHIIRVKLYAIESENWVKYSNVTSEKELLAS